MAAKSKEETKMKKTILILLIVGLALTVHTPRLFPFFLANDSCVAYDNCESSGITKAGISLGQLVVQGGGYFLTSNSEMLKFLNRVEMAELNGIDYKELREIMNAAVSNMETAVEIYRAIVSMAKAIPYDPAVIEQLKGFDYTGYAEKYKLNGEIWMEVKGYLGTGDVTGAYIRIEADMNNILKQLYRIQDAVESNRFPEIAQLWGSIHSYNVSLLFGTYMSEVFMNL